MGRKKTISLLLQDLTCVSCGISFGLERSFWKKAEENRTFFYCPNGCRLVFKFESKIAHDLRRKKDKQKKEFSIYGERVQR